MLTALYIKHFTIVDHLELDFKAGLTIFTGETGAGKSIMIDALMLALGGRAEVSVIRPGQEKCEITACFCLENDPKPIAWLQEHGVEIEEDTLIFRRIIHMNGRHKAFINGQPFPLQKIRALGDFLVHIHGQHEHHNLIHSHTHRDVLDRFAAHHDLVEEVRKAYQACQNIKASIHALTVTDSFQDREELLTYQINELQLLNCQEDEMRQLHEAHQLLHHAKTYLDQAADIQEMLESTEKQSISSRIQYMLNALDALPQDLKSIQNVKNLIQGALIHCEEALTEIKAFTDTIELNPERLQEIEQRISELYQASRKYQLDPNHLAAHCAHLQSELLQLKQREEDLIKLQQEYEAQVQLYNKAAVALSASRIAASKKLALAITDIIKKIGMPKGFVEFHISPTESVQPHGLDKVTCQVCTNPGMPVEDLSKVASGGELSRIGLAIQMITAEKGSTPTLLFDEVDVGIGGATAALVGKLLRNLASRLQVFCVTHQPQVASCAHQHFRVEKYSDEVQTYSRIIELEQPAQIDEIARMLGGLAITEQTKLTAKDLLMQNEES